MLRAAAEHARPIPSVLMMGDSPEEFGDSHSFVLNKPFDSAALLPLIRKALSAHQLDPETPDA